MSSSQSEQLYTIQRADVMGGDVFVRQGDVMALGDGLRAVSELHVQQPFGEAWRRGCAVLEPVRCERAPEIVCSKFDAGRVAKCRHDLPDAAAGQAEHAAAVVAVGDAQQLQQLAAFGAENDGSALVEIQVAFDDLKPTIAAEVRVEGDILPRDCSGLFASCAGFQEERNQRHVAHAQTAFAGGEQSVYFVTVEDVRGWSWLRWDGQPLGHVERRPTGHVQPAEERTQAGQARAHGVAAGFGTAAGAEVVLQPVCELMQQCLGEHVGMPWCLLVPPVEEGLRLDLVVGERRLIDAATALGQIHGEQLS